MCQDIGFKRFSGSARYILGAILTGNVKIYFESYGCTMNRGEAAELEEMARCSDHRVVSDPGDADLAILVTCCVIQATENRMWKRLRVLEKKASMVVLAGCLAAVALDRLKSDHSEVKVIPPDRYREFDDLFGPSNGSEHVPKADPRDISAALPVSSGCVGNCSYCITRLARGRLRSRGPEQLRTRMERLLGLGYREIRITSQDLGAWGRDLGMGLEDLMEELLEVEGDHMIRLGMMNPDLLESRLDEMIHVWNHPRVYSFVHLPLQSGSDPLLARMGRRYTAESYLNIIDRLKDGVSDLTISTDVIIGFPAESDRDYQATLEMIENIQPHILNITRFSPRQGTPAADMDGQVVDRIKKDRSRKLTRLHRSMSASLLERMMGKMEKVLVCERGKEGTTMSRTRSYLPVVLEGELETGKWTEARIVENRGSYLMGEAV